jgi:uncharacterized membrane protein YdbT with pleckstrin-like domain
MCAAFQGFIKDLPKHAGRSFSHTNAGYSEGMSMLTTTGTGFKAPLAVLAALIGIAAMLPVHWRAGARRAWSYGVYCVGYRLLSVQLTCGSWAVSGLTLVAKHA